MKITGIEIGEYRQFKNIKFDFTYPEGHPKAGQPLEKVCFIGQSGTGKTTLLEMILGFFGSIIKDDSSEISEVIATFNSNGISNNVHSTIDLYSISFKEKDHTISCIRQLGSLHGAGFDDFVLSGNSKALIKSTHNLGPDIVQSITETDKVCLYVKDSIAREADAFLADQTSQLQTFSDFVRTTGQLELERAVRTDRVSLVGFRKVVTLGDMESLSTWQYLTKELEDYDEASRSLVLNLVHKAQGASASKVIAELQKWLDSTPNPRVELGAKCLKPLLDKFHLEIDPEGSSLPITLRTKKGSKIPNNTLSTGTRQLLATAIPIYKFDTNGTVILFDEPERSLFPDIQRELVKYYTGLAPEAQFFFATHSPIIAAAFEPEERFILYFDENGEVKFRKGEAPIGDDPNDVLRKDFWMNPLMHEEGLAAYRKYLDLATQIRNETDEDKKNQLIVERLELGNLYNFAGQHAPY